MDVGQTISLTLGAHAPEGYSTHFVCVCVCVCVCLSRVCCLQIELIQQSRPTSMLFISFSWFSTHVFV